ncbi:MAG: ATP-binding protein [Anaerolineales bacterium]|nr:ATP-binding protein [Anaerolineales bacterium]
MRSLSTKLLLAFMAVIVTGTLLSAAVAQRVTRTVFGEFIFNQAQAELTARMADFYRARGSWAGVERFGGGPGYQNRPGQGGDPNRSYALLSPDGDVILPGLGLRHGMRAPQEALDEAVPIEVENEQVGLLLLTPRAAFVPSPLAEAFLSRINLALWFGALGAAALALLLGIFLARRLVDPLKEMTAATQAVAQGDLDIQVPVRSQDEVGQLAEAFNRMNSELARARDQRRQMTADIAHDLRTPISIISGYADGLADGVLDPNREMFSIIQDESKRLEVLVEDLRLLSLSDAGELTLNLAPVPPAGIVERAASTYATKSRAKNISLEVDTADGLPDVLVDADRMAQVMGHLLENALRHTPEQGRITLKAQQEERGSGVLLAVQDTGPGIPEEELGHIFDRFYRGDVSRQRTEARSGLGLAIARSLVESQGGKIWAESRPGAGAEMLIRLPAYAVENF